MKKIFAFLLPLAYLFIFASGVSAQSVEEISLFKSDIELKENTDIVIREEIHYYFPTYKHGLIREIPVDYKVSGGFKRPTTLSLQDLYYYPEGSPESKYTHYERSTASGYAIFKIGDPESTIQGSYVYVIEYTLKNAVNFFDDHDELYLNITGNGWGVPIRQAYANITVPGEITETICFTGSTGSEESQCTFETSGMQTKLTVGRELSAYEGYTAAIKMPKGTLEDTTGKQRLAFLLSNLGILIPIPVFIFVLGLVNKNGKNKKITIIPHYNPREGIDPLFAGFIHDKKVDNKHITAQIIQLAIDGYIKIKQEGKKKYILEKIGKEDSLEEATSQTLSSGIFKKEDSVNTKKIPSDFYQTVAKLQKELDLKAYTEEYFNTERRKFRTTLIILGVVCVFLGMMLMVPLSFIAATSWALGVLFSGIILFILSFKIDIRADLGNELYYELRGLRMYIDTAEKHRIEFHDNPEKFRGVFEKLLPFAIIFGLEKKWAKEFEDIYKEPPSWYEGNMNTFNSYMLANSLSNIGKSVQSASKPPNSAGGFSSSHGASGGSGFSGGSSGGGFGGGGGSSW